MPCYIFLNDIKIYNTNKTPITLIFTQIVNKTPFLWFTVYQLIFHTNIAITIQKKYL